MCAAPASDRRTSGPANRGSPLLPVQPPHLVGTCFGREGGDVIGISQLRCVAANQRIGLRVCRPSIPVVGLVEANEPALRFNSKSGAPEPSQCARGGTSPVSYRGVTKSSRVLADRRFRPSFVRHRKSGERLRHPDPDT